MGGHARPFALALALLLALLPALLLAGPARAGADCFLAKDLHSGNVLVEKGDCAARHSPASTFKIALALMGFDAGILKDAENPVFVTEPGLASGLPQWEGPQTPASWIRHSVVWYSQIVTLRLGAERFAHYVHAFHYGNENISGTPGQDDGLTRSWLSSSLAISPGEEVDFLSRMLTGRLPVSAKAVTQTISLLLQPEQPAGFALYGKTGAGTLPKGAGTMALDQPFGWFVGFVRTDKHTIVFARYLEGANPSEAPLSPKARAEVLAALPAVVAADRR